MNTFQTHMNQYPAPGIPGAFASDNPHASYVAGEDALITGPDGLVIARFAWVPEIWPDWTRVIVCLQV
ncbi:hypothetical protein DRC80_22970 [Salmonella enterica]|nr:hypothetical protein [Salmonella enterica]